MAQRIYLPWLHRFSDLPHPPNPCPPPSVLSCLCYPSAPVHRVQLADPDSFAEHGEQDFSIWLHVREVTSKLLSW